MPLSLFGLIDRWLAPAPDPGKVAWIARHVFAHRGLHAESRIENSTSAFEAAIDQGFGIECDVQRSRDGEAVVFHDWDLDRLTDRYGQVRKLSARELSAITLKNSEDCIQTLSQFLDQVAGRVPILIEVKSRSDLAVPELCCAVRLALETYGGLHAVMSFDPRVSRWFARNSPETVRGLVVTEEGEAGWFGTARRHLSFWHAAPDFLAYDIRDLPSDFAGIQRARGFPVTTWTVRTPELRRRAATHADAAIAEGAGIEEAA